MPGFAAAVADNCSQIRVDHRAVGSLLIEQKATEQSYRARFVNPKFANDKVFDEDLEVSVAIDGVLFNFEELKNQYGAADYFHTVKLVYQHLGTMFFRAFVGEFSGFLHDKRSGRWIVFVNHTGSKPVYYYHANDTFIVGSDPAVIVQILRQLGRSEYSLDVFGAYCLLTYGFMLEDHTLISEIKRLRPGAYLVFQEGRVVAESYTKVASGPPVHEAERDIIENLDTLFTAAVCRSYAKDREYDYAHLSTLSGGLDSRMNLWVAKNAGFNPLVAMTFSEDGHLDEQIARRIAADLGIDFVFYSLSGGHYLRSAFSDTVRANGGLVLFTGAAHLLAALRRISVESAGILHMGQLGDAVMGSYLSSVEMSTASVTAGAYSSHLVDRIADRVATIIADYESEELYLLNNRGFNGMLNGNWITYQYMECTSPFLDRDFLAYAMRTPRRLRYKEKLYRDWILTKHPRAADYVWEKVKTKLSRPVWWQHVSGLTWKAQILLRRAWNEHSMNPFYSWYRTNPELGAWTDSYWRDNAYLLDKHPDLKRDCANLFQNPGGFLTGPLVARAQVMTLLEAIRLYWGP